MQGLFSPKTRCAFSRCKGQCLVRANAVTSFCFFESVQRYATVNSAEASVEQLSRGQCIDGAKLVISKWTRERQFCLTYRLTLEGDKVDVKHGTVLGVTFALVNILRHDLCSASTCIFYILTHDPNNISDHF